MHTHAHTQAQRTQDTQCNTQSFSPARQSQDAITQYKSPSPLLLPPCQSASSESCPDPAIAQGPRSSHTRAFSPNPQPSCLVPEFRSAPQLHRQSFSPGRCSCQQQRPWRRRKRKHSRFSGALAASLRCPFHEQILIFLFQGGPSCRRSPVEDRAASRRLDRKYPQI